MARRSKRANRLSPGCVVLFALPFAGAGLFLMGMAVCAVIEHLGMRGWQQVPCTILSAELKSDNSDDGTTYQAKARYRYEVAGRTYQGTRVSLYSGSDNIGSFQQDAYRELKRHQATGQPFPGYVDPDNPSASILYRDIRWGMLALFGLLGMVFAGAGFGLLGGAVVARRKVQATEHRKKANPHQPWQWHEQWAAGKITSSNKTSMLVLVAFALFWNVVSLPVLFLLRDELMAEASPWVWLVLLFPAAGALLVGLAAWSVARFRKYGESVFEMARTPGVLGGSLAGVVRTTRQLSPPEGYRLLLSCFERLTTGSGKNRSTTETLLWQDERRIERGLDGPGAAAAIPVMFAIPYELPASTTDDDRRTITWRLEASAAVPGVNYYAAFDVPVLKTEESSRDFQLDESPLADYVIPEEPLHELRRAGVVCVPSPGLHGDRYIFPMLRHPATIAWMAVFLLVWDGVTAAMWHFGAPKLFPIVFGLMGLLMLAALVELMFHRSVVDVGPDGITVRGGLFGLGKVRRIEASQLKELLPQQGMRAGSHLYYNVVAVGRDGRQITLGKRLPNKRLAEAVIAAIKVTGTKSG